MQMLMAPRRLRLYLLTFNMARKAQNLDFRLMFPDCEHYDLIVIGGQETKMTMKTQVIIDFANYLGGYGFITVQ